MEGRGIWAGEFSCRRRTAWRGIEAAQRTRINVFSHAKLCSRSRLCIFLLVHPERERVEGATDEILGEIVSSAAPWEGVGDRGEMGMNRGGGGMISFRCQAGRDQG